MDFDQTPIFVFTAYSYEELRAFQRSHFRGNRFGFVAYTALFALMFFAVLFLQLTMGGGFGSLLVFLAAGTLFTTLGALFFNLTFYSRKQYLNGTKQMRNGQFYTFRSHDFTESSEQEDYTGTNSMHYSILQSVRETPDAFYLYQNKVMAYIISKQGFRSGSPDELRALLQGHVPPKDYVIVCVNDRYKRRLIFPVLLAVMIVAVIVVLLFL